MEIASFVWEVAKDIFPWVKRQVCHVVSYRRNAGNVRMEAERLKNVRNDVEGRVDAAWRKGEKIYDEVEAWLTNVHKAEDDVTALNVRVQQVAGCFSGWWPNCFTRYSLGKEAEKMVYIIHELENRGRSFMNVSYPGPPPGINSILAGDYLSFPSREADIEKIMKALENDTIGTVGICGMGGVGKTTLAKEVGKRVKSKGLFEEVVMVELGHKPDLGKIQGEIAGQLGLELDKVSEFVRQGQIMTRLQCRKTLLILDNVWENLELNKIGIPSRHERHGSKILLTTRSTDVCNELGTEDDVHVGVLSEEESWNFFEVTVGNAVDSSILDSSGRDIAKECDHLPLAIVTVATSLRNKDEFVWKDALGRLKKATPTGYGREKVFSCLELSYHYLQTDELKLCFLFCCLFPESSDIEVDVLMRYGFGEGFFEDDVETLKEAQERTHSLIASLKACCLLLGSGREGCVRMHDVVRDSARLIASQDKNDFIIKAGMKMENWPSKKKLDKCKRISLINSEISVLPERLDCPELKTLLLQGNTNLKGIPDGVVRGLQNLVVLDLSFTATSLLPCLVNLQALFLIGCSKLMDISPIGSMQKLEILCLKGTIIQELPNEMRNLSNLKLLDLSDTFFLRRIPANLISKLQRLEELYMENSFGEWEVEGWGYGRNASLFEVASLTRLTTLYITVKNAQCLSQEIPFSWTNVLKFRVLVDDEIMISTASTTRLVRLKISRPIAGWVKSLIERSKDVELVVSKLDNMEMLERLLDGLSTLLRDLRVLEVRDCEQMFLPSYLIKRERIELLRIIRCEKMEKIVQESPLPIAFENLRTVEVHSCNGLKNLLSWRLTQALQKLEYLTVYNCNEMEYIIADCDDEVDTTRLPSLRHIILLCLPNLRSFCQGGALFDLHSLEKIEALACPNLKRLPLGPNSAPSLLLMTGSSEWFHSLEWADDAARSRFKAIFESVPIIELISQDFKPTDAAMLPSVLEFLKTSDASLRQDIEISSGSELDELKSVMAKISTLLSWTFLKTQ
ncbi:hypothetical protein ACLOJK_002019 [Asimina triloba]